jgi:hypothetical protein
MSSLGDVEPGRVGGEIDGEVCAYPDMTHVAPPPMRIDGGGVSGLGLRISEEQRQISGQGGWVVLDREQHITALGANGGRMVAGWWPNGGRMVATKAGWV